MRSAGSRRPLVLVTLVCFVAACHKWVPLASPLEQSLTQLHGKVRITDEAGATVVFDTTWIARDSVLGIRSAYRIRGSRIRGGGDTIPVALLEVVKAEQQKPNTAGTIGLVVGGVVVAGGIFVAAVALAVCADPDASC